MRKALIAVVVASALFAVGAFAASFAVNAEDVASGADTVDACAAEVDLDFETVYGDDEITTDTAGAVTGGGDWNVDNVLVTFYDDTGTPTAACAGYGANVAVMTDAGTPATTGTAPVLTGASSVLVPLEGTLNAADITSAAVLVDGQSLQVGTPGEGF